MSLRQPHPTPPGWGHFEVVVLSDSTQIYRAHGMTLDRVIDTVNREFEDDYRDSLADPASRQTALDNITSEPERVIWSNDRVAAVLTPSYAGCLKVAYRDTSYPEDPRPDMGDTPPPGVQVNIPHPTGPIIPAIESSYHSLNDIYSALKANCDREDEIQAEADRLEAESKRLLEEVALRQEELLQALMAHDPKGLPESRDWYYSLEPFCRVESGGRLFLVVRSGDCPVNEDEMDGPDFKESVRIVVIPSSI